VLALVFQVVAKLALALVLLMMNLQRADAKVQLISACSPGSQ
jgi:hypothetical protein